MTHEEYEAQRLDRAIAKYTERRGIDSASKWQEYKALMEWLIELKELRLYQKVITQKLEELVQKLDESK